MRELPASQIKRFAIVRQDIGEARRRQTAVAAKPFEDLDLLRGDTDRVEAEARVVLEGRWTAEGGRLASVATPLDWSGRSRSLTFRLHAWDPLAPLLAAFSRTRKQVYFRTALAIVDDWLGSFRLDAAEIPAVAGGTHPIVSQHPYAWYDMGVGLRAYRLAYLFDLLARDPGADDAACDRLLEAVYVHLELLSGDAFFRAHNNHGLFQAVGQLAAATRLIRLDRMRTYAAQAERRIEELVAAHVADDGVHKEHSPDYQAMILTLLVGARSAGLLGVSLEAVLPKMEQALAWMIQPDRTLVTFGDTDPRLFALEPAAAAKLTDPDLVSLATGIAPGDRGALDGVRAFASGGYAFARLPVPSYGSDVPSRSYLAISAGFHSRAHKQADNLSLVWYDRRTPILVDPGRYAYSGQTERKSALRADGFWYDDPARVLVESSQSHNVVTVDGLNHARVQGTPFGSAVDYADEQAGLAVFECSLKVDRTVRQRRIVIGLPGEFLLVLDWLSDTSGEEHRVRQHWQMAPAWRVEQTDGGLQATSLSLPAEILQVRSLAEPVFQGPAVTGQTEGGLQGWISGAPNLLVPAPSFALEATGATVAFATLFAFGLELNVDPAKQRMSPTLTKAAFAWEIDGRSRRLALTRTQGVPPRVILH
jgi:hypothetical protein